MNTIVRNDDYPRSKGYLCVMPNEQSIFYTLIQEPKLPGLEIPHDPSFMWMLHQMARQSPFAFLELIRKSQYDRIDSLLLDLNFYTKSSWANKVGIQEIVMPPFVLPFSGIHWKNIIRWRMAWQTLDARLVKHLRRARACQRRRKK